MRIPISLDTPPPLIAPGRMVDEPAKEGRSRGSKNCGRKKADGQEYLAWSQEPGSSLQRDKGNEQAGLLVAGGVALSVLIAAGVFLAMNGGIKPFFDPLGQIVTPPAAVKNLDDAAIPPAVQRSDTALLAEAESMARKFLEARTVEELLPLVRNPAVAEGRMRGFYPEGKIEATGMQPLGSAVGFSVRDKLVALVVRTRDFEEKSLAFIDTPQGLKIDWESWVGWSEISWEKFMESKPTSGHVFRVILAAVDYYNFEFTDDQKWQSYRLESPDQEHVLYGYAEKGTDVSGAIHLAADIKSIKLMLSLKFPAGATTDNQVKIERFVSEGWVEEADSL